MASAPVHHAGPGLPFLFAAVFTNRFGRAVWHPRHRGRWLNLGAGVIMIIAGLAMMAR